ncbi:MAG TPA: DinB family protein, partial [Chryseolinea sp.]
MKKVTEELQRIVADYATKISSIPEKEFTAKPLPNKWSKKEVLGHLIDSAQNNLRRFICGQYETTPPHIIYEQDFWVSANAYGKAKSEHVIQLWQLINNRLCDVLNAMPVNNYDK